MFLPLQILPLICEKVIVIVTFNRMLAVVLRPLYLANMTHLLTFRLQLGALSWVITGFNFSANKRLLSYISTKAFYK